MHVYYYIVRKQYLNKYKDITFYNSKIQNIAIPIHLNLYHRRKKITTDMKTKPISKQLLR